MEAPFWRGNEHFGRPWVLGTVSLNGSIWAEIVALRPNSDTLYEISNKLGMVQCQDVASRIVIFP